jgi:osmotically-inducible protein OsmY
MSHDETIRQNVLDHLEWSPHVNATHIGVAVRDGIVELSGHVDTYVEKLQAEQVALAVKGVRGVAQEISVRLPDDKKTNDDEIAERAARILSWDTRLSRDTIKVKVEKGWVTLTGEVKAWAEREFALSDVKKLSGVVGVTNAISIKPVVSTESVASKIEDALKRQALLDSKSIEVVAHGSKVILNGRVHSWAEKSAARHAAWGTLGVNEVVDNLRVDLR